MDVKNLTAKAARVAAMRAAREKAFAAEKAAEVELLDSVVGSVEPALPALVSKIVGGEVGDAPWELRPVHLLSGGGYAQGVLVGERGWKETPDGYSGVRLFLMLDMTFLEVERTRSLSTCGWEGQTRGLTYGQVTDDWKIEMIVQRITEALDAQIAGSSEARTQAALARAERLRALSTLMRPYSEKGLARAKKSAAPHEEVLLEAIFGDHVERTTSPETAKRHVR
jgi:hypothetical protein